MSIRARLRSWVGAAFGREILERRMQAEMQTHLDFHEADLRRRGLSAAEAHRQARADFGSLAAHQDECREALGLRLLDELRADVVYALRLLRRSPAFAAVALLSLALGIGANTAIFSLVDMVMMKSLPVRDPASLVFVDTSAGKSGGSNGPPYPLFERMRDTNTFLSGVAAFNEDMLRVTIDNGPEPIRSQHASGNYFDLLGVRAVHGRRLTPADDSVFGHGGPDGAVAVISYRLWKERFALDPNVLGRVITVGSRPVTIVGVTEPEFFGLQVGQPVDLTLPMMLAGDNLRSKGTWWMSTIARLRPGVTVEQARAELDVLFGGYLSEIGMERKGYFSALALVPAGRGLNELRRQFSAPLLILMGIVAVVLIIGCANVANLLLARASARRAEVAVRLAIGASRSRLIRQMLTEGAVLVTLGAAAGLVLAQAGVSFVAGFFNEGGRGLLLEPRFDLRILGFTAAVAVGTVLLFSIAPALHATRVDAAKPGVTTTAAGAQRIRLGQWLVVLQVGLAIALMCGAALFLRTLGTLDRIDAGFVKEGLLTMQVEASMPTYGPTATPDERRATHARIGALWTELASRVAALPGVTSASVGTLSPLSGRGRGVRVAVAGVTVPEDLQSIRLNQVSPGYFQTLGVSLLSGRLFAAEDRSGSKRVAILNETAARAYFSGASPLGRTLNFPRQRVEDAFEIVGVVRDVRYESLRKPDERMVYLPIEQAIDPIGSLMLHTRTTTSAALLVPVIRGAVGEIVPNGLVARTGTIEQRVATSLVSERLLSILATFFGALALALACIGLYGVTAFAVIRRTREIGIRIAIGAAHTSVVWMMLRETLALVVAGVVIGTFASLAAGRYVSAQLFGVAPGDPLSTTAAIVVLLLVTFAAAFVPARRASRIAPTVALRYE